MSNKDLLKAEQIRQFWQRCLQSLPQQYRPKITEVFEDPVTGRRAKLAPGRQHRHVETDKASTSNVKREGMKA